MAMPFFTMALIDTLCYESTLQIQSVCYCTIRTETWWWSPLLCY